MGGEVLAAAFLRVDKKLHLVMKLIGCDGFVLVLFKPFFVNFGVLLAAFIALLRLGHANLGIVAAERDERVPDPSAPLLKATKRQTRLYVGRPSAKSPDRQQCRQEFYSPRLYLGENVDRE